MLVTKKEHEALKKRVAVLEAKLEHMEKHLFFMDQELHEMKKKDKETAYFG